jgi:hypothetical protein
MYSYPVTPVSYDVFLKMKKRRSERKGRERHSHTFEDEKEKAGREGRDRHIHPYIHRASVM